MSKQSSAKLPCPNCKKEVQCADNLFFPFCSERCKMIDLGAWLDAKYVIEGEKLISDEGREETH